MPDNTEQRKSSSGAIVDFYFGHKPDSEGRMIGDIHAWDYRTLEAVHNYIQWLFPTRTRSNYNYNAPLPDEAQIRAFRTDAELRSQLLKSLKLMLAFYGFSLADTGEQNVRIVKSGEWSERSRNWLSPGNHNHLRITRILESLRLFGLDEYAEAFFAVLDQVYRSPDGRNISATTYNYWKSAAGQ